MTHANAVPRPPDPATLQAVRGRFLSLNQERLKRTREALGEPQRLFLDLIPLLFHINDPKLPGFFSELAPAAIPDYRPSPAILDAARALHPGFDYTHKMLRAYRIRALFLMGSAGSIAQSPASDLDFWVCIPPNLEPRDLEALMRKCWLLEEWAATLGVEAHFFLVEEGEFRAGLHGVVTDESSGSAQHHLLLDEFYRTAQLIAGHPPAWWLVPPERERDYGAALEDLIRRGVLEREAVVDFGGLGRVPPGEFYGATLWQLYKGIDAPYKSLLKILVMEGYAAGYPDGELLSQRLKRAVWEESDASADTLADTLDPYLLMGRYVEEYLAARDEQERLELARRAFYFKVGEPLADAHREENPRRRRLRAITQGWGWDTPHLRFLDSRCGWKADRVMEERRALVGAFIAGYRRLSEFGRRHGEAMAIGQGDLALLGNKLHAAFERKAGKVELINPGISDRLAEEALSIHRLGGPLGTWSLYRGTVDTARREGREPLRRTRSLVELLAWCHYNGLIGADTALHFHPHDDRPADREVSAILRYLEQTAPAGSLEGGSLDELARSPRVLRAALFVNVALDPLAHHTRRGIQIASARNDPLRFGSQEENLVVSCDLIAVTSWREVLTFRHTGETALLDALCEYLGWAPPHRGEAPPQLEVHGDTSPRSQLLARRLEGVVGEVVAHYYGAREGAAQGRYLIRLGRAHYLLWVEGEALHYERHDSHQELMARLAAPAARYSPLAADPRTLDDTPLPTLFRRDQAGRIQLFYQPLGPLARVYVLDERGSLFHQEVEYRSDAVLLSHFERFFFSVLPRRHYVQGLPSSDVLDDEVAYHRIDRDPDGRWQITPVQPKAEPPHRRYFNLQVIGERAGTGQSLFTLYCDEREFSSLEYGEGLFRAVAAHILARRADGERYPLYITDVDIGQLLSGEGGGEVQTIHFLNYKKRIEERLNEQLSGLP
ncbi:class I adenylate cyclase [Endothiovibrio diazotrophicus]